MVDYYNPSPGVLGGIQAGFDFQSGTVPAATGFTSNTGATDTLAQLTRDQWEYYKRVGVPIEDELFESYRNPELWDRSISAARESTGAAFGGLKGQSERAISRYGVGLTARQQQSTDKQMDLQKKAATVKNVNDTRKMLQERDDAIMTGVGSQVNLTDLNA